MKYLFRIVAIGLFITSCSSPYIPRETVTITIDSLAMEQNSIRAIELSEDGSLWYAGSNGSIGHTSSDLEQIVSTPLQYDSITPHFRSIAVVKDTVFALSIANPALLYKLYSDQSELVYTEEHPKVFYDAMTFFDDKHGIAMGDPTENCLSIIKTNDGGSTWQKIACDDLPTAYEGEAAFAASNTNITAYGTHGWIVTGGSKARIFHTADMGTTWEVYDTPIVQGKSTSGIYSVDFYDEYQGIICGGDFTDKYGNSINKALTFDGGKTWEVVSENTAPKYISCVQYIPGTDGQEVMAVSTNGVFYSKDQGRTWTQVSDRGYYSIRIADSNTAWVSGGGVIAKLNIQ